MSKTEIHIAPGKFFLWGTMILGIWAAFYAGNQIADDGYAKVFLDIALLLGVVSVLTVRSYWWIPVFVIGVFGFSTGGLGFKLDGTDMMALFGFACLFAMLCMGRLHPKNAQRNLGVFFYLLLGYAIVHAALYGVDNYFNGDTQFKNIAKRYYALIAPLVLIWCMDRYAHPKGMRRSINLMILVTVLFSIVGVVVVLRGVPIPVISENLLNFSWADDNGVLGYLRWGIPPIFLLVLCMRSTSSSATAGTLYGVALVILTAAVFFGGGRISLLLILLCVASWLMIRKKWKQVMVGGWVALLACVFLAIAGHTMDARQLQNMPRSFQNVQRAISIFLPSDQIDDTEVMTSGSDQWHEDLIKGAWDSANEDYHSMIFGKGFKGWDDSIDINMFTYGEAYDEAVKIAVRMGSTETMFFSILPILGWTGALLYYGFMIELLRRYLRVMKLCPERSLEKSLCEYSFCLILCTLLISPISGTIPAYNMIYWIVGLVAAEPYIRRVSQQQTASDPRPVPMPMIGARGGMVGR